MNLKLYFIIACFSYTGLSFAQKSSKIYFIEKIKPEYIFSDPTQYSLNMKLQSAGGEIYRYRNGIKEDSLFVIAEEFQLWKDSVAFSIQVPNRFVTNNSTLSLRPIFYLKKEKTKGELSKYLLGKEQAIKQLVLKIKSDPSGAKVYLVPKLYWELNPALAKFNIQALLPYVVSEGLTTVNTNVQEHVYVVIFQYKNKFSIIPCAPNHLHSADSVYTKFN